MFTFEQAAIKTAGGAELLAAAAALPSTVATAGEGSAKKKKNKKKRSAAEAAGDAAETAVGESHRQLALDKISPTVHFRCAPCKVAIAA